MYKYAVNRRREDSNWWDGIRSLLVLCVFRTFFDVVLLLPTTVSLSWKPTIWITIEKVQEVVRTYSTERYSRKPRKDDVSDAL